MENKGSGQEKIFGTQGGERPELGFGEPEVLVGEGQNLEKTGEIVSPNSEILPAQMDMMPPNFPEVSDSGDVVENTFLEAKSEKNAERVSKSYVQACEQIAKKYANDPFEFQKQFGGDGDADGEIGLKWKYLRDTFGRDLNDGLDGQGAVGKVA